MVRPGIALAFSGAIGSGKSSVSGELQRILGWPRVSFGDFVRKQATAMGRDATDRTVLQNLGQALVVSNLEGFVRDVLGQEPGWADADGIIIDGLRHSEVRDELIRQVHPKVLKLVMITVDEDARLARARKEKAIEGFELSRYDRDVTEAQIRKTLPDFADLQIENGSSPSAAAEAVVHQLNLRAGTSARREG